VAAHAIDSPFSRSPCILVVDDEAQVRQFLEDLLTENGFDVKTAGDGREALGALTQERFDLVLTDLKMPGMDGWEMSEHLLVRYPRLPIVMLTGFGTAIEHQAQSRGIPLLHKPVDAVELIRTIRKALAHAVG
jgi:CheY-like chemotaxis protein